MNELQHTQAGIAADLLGQGRLVRHYSLLASGVALLGLIISPFTSETLTFLLVAAAIMGLVQLYLAMRVDFDRALFERLARGLQPETMDSILVALHLIPGTTAPRSLTGRIAGSLRLLKLQCAVTVIQYLLIIVAVIL